MRCRECGFDSLLWEDPTSHRATKPTGNYWALEGQLESPWAARKDPTMTQRRSRVLQPRPSAAKQIKKCEAYYFSFQRLLIALSTFPSSSSVLLCSDHTRMVCFSDKPSQSSPWALGGCSLFLAYSALNSSQLVPSWEKPPGWMELLPQLPIMPSYFIFITTQKDPIYLLFLICHVPPPPLLLASPPFECKPPEWILLIFLKAVFSEPCTMLGA